MVSEAPRLVYSPFQMQTLVHALRPKDRYKNDGERQVRHCLAGVQSRYYLFVEDEARTSMELDSHTGRPMTRISCLQIILWLLSYGYPAYTFSALAKHSGRRKPIGKLEARASATRQGQLLFPLIPCRKRTEPGAACMRVSVLLYL